MSGRHAPDGRPVTVPRLGKMKRDGERITMVTAYDATFAQLFDEAGVSAKAAGHYHDSAGILVQPVHDSRARQCRQGRVE